MSGNQSGTASETKLCQSGMKVRMPKASDSSTRCSGGSVNSGTTRDSVAPSHSLGPREA
jgi:hypothetical protein